MKQLLTIIILLTLVGCYNKTTANKHIDKAGKFYPELLAEEARDKFPCITTASDTTILLVDSLVYVTCPDDYFIHTDTVVINGKTIYRTDTLTVVKGKTVPVFLPAKTIFITTKIEDSAKVKLMAKEVAKLSAVIIKKDKKIATVTTWSKVGWGLAIFLLLGAGILIYLKVRK